MDITKGKHHTYKRVIYLLFNIYKILLILIFLSNVDFSFIVSWTIYSVNQAGVAGVAGSLERLFGTIYGRGGGTGVPRMGVFL